jgi:transcription-repair coupling factor (superfamily II helicase)
MKATRQDISLEPPAVKTIFGAPEGQDARILAEHARDLMRDDRVLAHVAMDDARMAALADLLAFFAPDVRVVQFPAWDCLPYDRVSPHNDVVAKRVAALSTLLEWEAEERRYPRILLTTVNAAVQRVTPRSILKAARFIAAAGGRIDPDGLTAFLARNGYTRTETVREPGEYAQRGGIMDLFPPGYDEPLRIDLFGDTIESIRAFDPATQRTDRNLTGFSLGPVTEFFLDPDSIARFRSGYRDLFGIVRADDPLYEAVSAGRRYNGMDHWLPLFFERMDTVFDYAPKAFVTMDAQAEQARSERLGQIRDFYAARRTLEDSAKSKKNKKDGGDVSLSGTIYHPVPVERLFVGDEEWKRFVADYAILSPFASPSPLRGEGQGEGATEAKRGRDFADIRALPDGDVFGELRKYINDFLTRRPPHPGPLPGGERGKKSGKVVIACYSVGSRERLSGLITHLDLKNCDHWEDVRKLNPGQVGMILLPLEHGFVAPDLAVITEQDILGDRLARRVQKRRKADNFLTEVSSLSPGDLVVHVDHGVGRFESLETIEAAGTVHDCLKIVYDGGDRLFVPVENIEVLSRFGSDEGLTHLDRLGGAGWQARKARVKKDLMRMAEGLLKIAAARMTQRAEKLHVDSGMFEEFIARFPYQETDDQLKSIEDVLRDLEQDHPMDRLICGDVGFGKTEVALRAAFVAALSGVQVAVVVPTTLLARQHYQNFMKRFAGLGLRIEQLSRFVTPKDAQKVKDGLADGTVNIVIGTHALFGKSVKFKHLGLLVVDEEQRFGVKQKEYLKELKANVHVLTLSATPIPRTLQMSLTGVRDLSLMATPPVDRLAIRTFVLPFDPVVIREAILREHHRGGQSFYVCPRISDIAGIEETLKELVPEVKVIAAHGQMPPGELEDRMEAFYDRQYHVLLATNIIENGIDIPTANTMIIHRADMFGLSQLYQIRGRIGRSKMRAYAYLTYAPSGKLTDYAQKRLEVIETLDTLGSGFQLASHDMDIRGAGNLLGEEQSGHIREVGVELYQQMLEEAVAEARSGAGHGDVAEDRWSPQINIGTSVLIPERYVTDLNVRMSLYRRLSELEDKNEIESFAAEMIDRFGPIPDEVENLLGIMAIKQLCRKAGIDKVDAGPKGAVISFHNDSPPNIPGLMGWIQARGGVAVKLRPDQKLVAIRSWDNPAHRVKGVQGLMEELAALG